MRKERKILRFVPQKLRKNFANGNPREREDVKLECEEKREGAEREENQERNKKEKEKKQKLENR